MAISATRKLLLHGAAAVSLALPGVAWAQAREFNVPAQSGTKSIPEFARQAGIQIIAPGSRLRDVRTAELKGTHDVRAALGQLLRGTRLRIVADTGSTITLAAAEQPAQPVARPGPQSSGEANAGSAAADNAGAADTAGDEGTRDGEIIITAARRKAENIQRVPAAITSISQETITKNNIGTFQELQYLVPSLSATSALSRDSLNINIRGQGANFTGVAGVVTYLNEVPLPGNSAIDNELSGGPGLLFDLESVQVLKGPQGTLFGKNVVGGALLLRSSRPTNEAGGHIQLGIGNYNNREAQGVINVPIVPDKLLARFAFMGQVRDGFTRVLSTPTHPNGTDLDNRKTGALRATLTFHPVDGFRNDTIFNYVYYSSHGTGRILVDGRPTAFLGGLYAPLILQQQALGIRTSIPLSSKVMSQGDRFTMDNITEVDITDSIRVRNIFGYDRSMSKMTSDGDGSSAPIFDAPYNPYPKRYRQFTEEIQVLGDSLSGKLDWLFGAFFLDLKNPRPYFADSIVLGGYGWGVTTRHHEVSKAVYAHASYRLTPKLRLSAGTRYTWDQNSTSGGSGPSIDACLASISTCPNTIKDFPRASSKALTYNLGLDYQIAERTLLYLTTRRGYRPGGRNGVDILGEAPAYGPEYVTDFEFGFKSDWHIGSIPVRSNAAAYYQNVTDIQVAQSQTITTTIPPTIIVRTANAGKARVVGVELELSAKLTKNFEIGGNFNYLDLKYTKFLLGVSPSAQALFNAQRQTNRPPYKFSLNAKYSLPVGDKVGDISIGGVWGWQSKSTSSLTRPQDIDHPFGRLDSFGVLNLWANWNRIYGSPVDLSLFASNALNKKYVAGALNAYSNPLGMVNLTYGEPRMYGARLRYRFGGEEHR